MLFANYSQWKIALVIAFVFHLCRAQTGIGYNLVPRLYIEQYKPFKFKRPSDFNFKMNVGLGADFELHFGNSAPDKKIYFSGGPLVGQNYFWNKKVKCFEYPFPYKENNFVSKLGAHFGIGNWTRAQLIKRKGFCWGIGVQGGGAFIENRIINQNTKAISGAVKWSHFYSIDINCLLFSRRGFPVLLLGFGYTNIDGKHFNGILF